MAPTAIAVLDHHHKVSSEHLWGLPHMLHTMHPLYAIGGQDCAKGLGQLKNHKHLTRTHLKQQVGCFGKLRASGLEPVGNSKTLTRHTP